LLRLVESEKIPGQIEEVETDVIELAPTTWIADHTDVSKLSPEQQRMRLGLKQGPGSPKRQMTIYNPKTPSGESDLSKWMSEMQNQGGCGSCTGFGNTGVWEVNLHKAIPGDTTKLSEAHLFFCSRGLCGYGNTVEAVLNRAMVGVCLESCLPYNAVDQACALGICDKWWETAKKLAGWRTVADRTEQLVLLDNEGLNATMAVHQSFFNYVSGVYKHLGAGDPVVGYHDIGAIGYSLSKLPSNKYGAKLIRNSWGKGWGSGCVGLSNNPIPGCCWISSDELDPEMQQLILDGVVPPQPPPPPRCEVDSDCPLGYICENGECVPSGPPMPTPVIDSISPNTALQGWKGPIKITGSVFNGLAWISLGAKIDISDMKLAYTTPQVISATIAIAPDAAVGARDVAVNNGFFTGSLPGGFTVEELPGPTPVPPTPSPCCKAVYKIRKLLRGR